MSLNTNIIDQRVQKLADRLSEVFKERLRIGNDTEKLRSVAFTLFVLTTVLDLSEDEALDALTEGGGDFGVDAMHLSDVDEQEFRVTIVQSKYKKRLDGVSAFPQGGVEKVLQAVKVLFDPDLDVALNRMLETKVEMARSLVRDGYIPSVRVLLANNGLRWTEQTEEIIRAAALGSQVSFEHVGPDRLISLLISSKPVDHALRLTGRALIEEFDFRRVLVGRIAVSELRDLFEAHGDRLLEKNIRRYLGVHKNRVNENIRQTLECQKERVNFYFYNNGVTIVCKKFQHNALQGENWPVKLSGLQVINGGQTCRTIQEVFSAPDFSAPDAFVLVRIYEIAQDSEDLVRNITYATNSQNPVDLRDLKSNDARQFRLEESISGLGYTYRRQRSSASTQAKDITSQGAAEAVFSIWRKRPHQGKFQSSKLFGKFYDMIFTDDLNGAQVIAAVLLFRIAENKRRHPRDGAPEFVRYASSFLAMLMGRRLLENLEISLSELSHLNFKAAEDLIRVSGDVLYQEAVDALAQALRELYGEREVSLQRLSATFRRGDLMEYLKP